MTFRSVVISNQCYLQVANRQLAITKGTEQLKVPLEDIACIILNHYAISLSATLLSECAEHNIVLISCDKTHTPNGIFHSHLPHSRQSLVIQTQINLSIPFKKRLWQTIIIQKIIKLFTVIKIIINDFLQITLASRENLFLYL